MFVTRAKFEREMGYRAKAESALRYYKLFSSVPSAKFSRVCRDNAQLRIRIEQVERILEGHRSAPQPVVNKVALAAPKKTKAEKLMMSAMNKLLYEIDSALATGETPETVASLIANLNAYKESLSA